MKHNLKIFLFFFAAGIVGTVSHEYGHAFMVWIYGFHPEVHYGSCNFSVEDLIMVRQGLMKYDRQWHDMLFRLGGPLQTTLTGMIGLIGLWIIRRKEIIDAWNTKHLLFITLAFFHSREVFNSAVWLIARFFTGSKKLYRGDEINLMWHWGITNYALAHFVLWIVFSLVLAYVAFVLVKRHRLQLIVFGGAGAFAGGLLWLYWLGPILMP